MVSVVINDVFIIKMCTVRLVMYLYTNLIKILSSRYA